MTGDDKCSLSRIQCDMMETVKDIKLGFFKP